MLLMMLRKTTFILKLIVSIILMVQVHSAWAYKKTDMKFSDLEFRRWIRPQIRTIVSEYYSLLSYLEDDYKSKTSISRDYKKVWYTLDRYLRCSSKCTKDYSRIDKQLTSLIETLDALNGEKETTKNDLEAEQILEAKHLLTTAKTKAFSLWTRINNTYQVKQDFNVPMSEDRIKALVTLFMQSYYHYQLHMVTLLNAEYRELFELAWTGYLFPLETKVVFQSNTDYLKFYVNDLNIAWNQLHLALTKRNIKISKKTKTLLNVMHRRWNSILKIGLR
jgi:hypothetical protein